MIHVREIGFPADRSPPSRWSGLKLSVCCRPLPCQEVSTLAVEWIEIRLDSSNSLLGESPPSRWSGLKSLPACGAPLPSASPPSRWSGLKFRGSLIAVHIIASPLSRRSKLKIRQLQNYIQLPSPLPFSQTPQSLLNCKKRLDKTNSVQQKRWGKPHPFHNLVRMYKECILPLSLPCPNLFKPRHQHLSAGFQNDPSLFSCGA